MPQNQYQQGQAKNPGPPTQTPSPRPPAPAEPPELNPLGQLYFLLKALSDYLGQGVQDGIIIVNPCAGGPKSPVCIPQD
jgi:hypothetical protein